MKNAYSVAVILYQPDLSAVNRIKKYAEIFEQLIITDNTEHYDNDNRQIIEALESVKELPGVVYHSMNGNKGMSCALNYAFHWASEHDIDYLLTMDQDTDFPEQEIRKMIEHIDLHGALNIAIYAANWRKIYKKGDKESYGPWKHKEDVVAIKRSMTSGSFYNIGVIRKLLPLPDLFIGMVDDDLSYAVRKSGYHILTLGFVKLSQRVGKQIEDTPINRLLHKVVLSPERYYLMARNSMYLIRKYTGNSEIVKDILLGRIRIIGNLLLCEDNRGEKIRMWVRGNRDGGRSVRVCGEASGTA